MKKTKLNPGKSNFLDKPIELLCSNDDLRPAMQCVYFHDGNLIATDAYALIKQSLCLHGFDTEDIEKLEGKMLHKSSLKLMKKCDYFIINENGITCVKGMSKVTHEFINGEIYPDYKRVIPKENDFSCSSINFDAQNAFRLDKCLFFQGNESTKYSFTGVQKAILVTTDFETEKQIGLFMPTT